MHLEQDSRRVVLQLQQYLYQPAARHQPNTYTSKDIQHLRPDVLGGMLAPSPGTTIRFSAAALLYVPFDCCTRSKALKGCLRRATISRARV
ncbi:hypothetical protein M404DRAFT_1002690 [Pisolithus tinctorius Marx 270]|uniref:Uncharacterized protein n=1 Tax=Pisolithus tinctorius Marx 270 TaxID=870435 RepID=A0A0C3NLZ9_PISTI|nr:hypothetical protein M404DRAFT_1002690 [Pisolithus tinctorius Marx 270]